MTGRLSCVRRHPWRSLVIALAAVLFAWGGSWFAGQIEQAQQIRSDIKKQGQYLIECTTRGPNPPDAAGNTGHPCWDEGQRRTAKAVAAIVDSNGNGVADIRELAEALGVPLPPPAP